MHAEAAHEHVTGHGPVNMSSKCPSKVRGWISLLLLFCLARRPNTAQTCRDNHNPDTAGEVIGVWKCLQLLFPLVVATLTGQNKEFSQMPASDETEQLLAGPLESLARLSGPDAQGPAKFRLQSARLFRMLLDRDHQVPTRKRSHNLHKLMIA